MRDYQIRGLNWMISLYENGINGILADEMVNRLVLLIVVIKIDNTAYARLMQNPLDKFRHTS